MSGTGDDACPVVVQVPWLEDNGDNCGCCRRRSRGMWGSLLGGSLEGHIEEIASSSSRIVVGSIPGK